MEFIDKLWEFLFTPGHANLASARNGHLIFAAASTFMGFVVVALDFVLFTIKKKFLELVPSGKRSLLKSSTWDRGVTILFSPSQMSLG